MRAVGDKQAGTIRPEFDRSISIVFQGAKITSHTGFLLMREIDQRLSILSTAASQIDDPRSARHTDHSLLQLLRHRVCQVAAGCEDCNDADHLRVDPALRLALGKEHESGAGQSALCRFENSILATPRGLKALENALSRCAGALLRRRNKRRLIIDVDSTEDPVHGNQEGAAFNGYFEQLCYHPLFCFTSKGDLLSERLRPGNAHSSDGVLDLISPLVERYRSWFKQFWLRGDAAFADPDLYEFCETKRITCFIRLPANNSLKKIILPHLNRPVGRPPEDGVQVKVIESITRTSCHRFAANQARLLVGCLAYNLLHMVQDAAFCGESIKPSIDSIIRRLVKVGARVVYHARKWYVHVASAFSLARYYRILLA